jgi:hypothetical protein
MRSAIMLDTRNALDRERLVRNGFRYLTIAGLEGSGDASRPSIEESDLLEATSRR